MRWVAYVAAFFVAGTVGLLAAVVVAVVGHDLELVQPALLAITIPLQVLSLLGVALAAALDPRGARPRSVIGAGPCRRTAGWSRR